MQNRTNDKFITISNGKDDSGKSVIVLSELTNELPVLKLNKGVNEKGEMLDVATGHFGKRLDPDTIFTLPLKAEQEFKLNDRWLYFASSDTLQFSPSLALLRRLVIELFPDWKIDGNDLEALTKAINEATSVMTVGERQKLAQRAYALCVEWKCLLKVTYRYEEPEDDYFSEEDIYGDTCDDERVLRSNHAKYYDGSVEEYIGSIILPVVNEF